MASSAAVHDALAEIFDKRDLAVIAVSGYDETILYANGAFSKGIDLGAPVQNLPIDFVGRSIRDVADLYQVRYEDYPIAHTLRNGKFSIAKVQTSPLWMCASTLKTADISPTGIASLHSAELTALEAERQHWVLHMQATITLEFCESERLIQVGMEALHRARQRIHTLKETLLSEELAPHFPNG